MKRFVTVVVACMVAVAALICGCASGSQETLYVYNWGDYIDESVLEMFEKETGIRVVYDMFDTNEDMYIKLKTGANKYDIVVPSDYMIERLIREDLVQTIDFAQIPNYQNIDERFLNMAYDPDNSYSVPYMWGTVGILYNTTMVKEPVDSWDILWNEAYKNQILMLNSPRDSIAVALLKLGYDMNTRDEAQLEEAKAALIEQNSLVHYVNDEVKDKMIGGNAALAVVWSGDAIYCMEENPDLAYVVPKEGSNIWVDGIAIPKNAQNKAAAETFINFLCRPDIALMNTDYIGYSTPNKEAMAQQTEDRIQSSAYNPSDEVCNRCTIFLDLGDFTEVYDRLWTEIRSSGN